MQEAHIPMEVTTAVAKILNNTSFTIENSEGTPESTIRTNKGVQQGSVIAPSLFSIYIATLLRRLEATTGCVMAWADDLAFTCTSKI
jgi:hypothetical protein